MTVIVIPCLQSCPRWKWKRDSMPRGTFCVDGLQFWVPFLRVKVATGIRPGWFIREQHWPRQVPL